MSNSVQLASPFSGLPGCLDVRETQYSEEMDPWRTCTDAVEPVEEVEGDFVGRVGRAFSRKEWAWERSWEARSLGVGWEVIVVGDAVIDGCAGREVYG